MKAGTEKKPIVLVLVVVGLCLFFAVSRGKIAIGSSGADVDRHGGPNRNNSGTD
ncbi:hypothetical protein ACFL3G_09845 [Planctomycetota bacterium]